MKSWGKSSKWGRWTHWREFGTLFRWIFTHQQGGFMVPVPGFPRLLRIMTPASNAEIIAKLTAMNLGVGAAERMEARRDASRCFSYGFDKGAYIYVGNPEENAIFMRKRGETPQKPPKIKKSWKKIDDSGLGRDLEEEDDDDSSDGVIIATKEVKPSGILLPKDGGRIPRVPWFEIQHRDSRPCVDLCFLDFVWHGANSRVNQYVVLKSNIIDR